MILHTDWRGMVDRATTARGRPMPCQQPLQCPQIRFPAATYKAYNQSADLVARQTWYGSLIEEKTDDSGLMYMRNRYYNPTTGTFTQEDPIGLAGGLNSYGFANGDPAMYSDPYGLSASCNPPTPECVVGAQLRATWAAIGKKADGLRRGLLSLASNLPVIGDGNDVSTAATGYDALNQERVGVGGRFLAGVGAISPIGSGGQFRSIADAIGRGHAFVKHVVQRGEFVNHGIGTQSQFSNLIENIMQSASGADVKTLANGRTGYWDSGTGTVVIHDPHHADKGTAFRPTGGRAYFDNLQ